MADTTRSVKIFINGKEIENTMKSIRNEYSKTSAELNHLTVGSEEYNKKIEELKALGSILDEHAGRLRRVGEASSFMSNMGSALGVMTGAQLLSEGIMKLGNEFSAGVEDLKSYSTNLAEMADVMELTQDEIKDFEARAQSLTTVTLGSGQSIKTSSGDILEAFKLVAGAMPALKDVEGGLESVTQSALVLSMASGEDLATSVNTLTTVMGQYGASAEEAERIINALAAGSKVGAAETTDVAESMKVFGVVAANSNVTIEESVGLIETLASKQIKGAEAGTQLRNILLQMSAVDIMPEKGRKALEAFGVNLDVLSDKSLSMEVRLKELAKTGGDNVAMVAAFGKENAVAAATLSQNTGLFKEFAAGVTDTTAAYESATTKSQSFAVAMADMKVQWDNIRLAGTKFIVEAATPMLAWAGAILSGLAALPKWIYDNRTSLIALGVAIAAFNAEAALAAANSLRLAAAEKGRLIITNATTVAQRVLNTVMRANPIGLVISAVALLVAGFTALYNRSATVRAGIAGLGAVASEVFKIIKEAVQAFASGWSKLKDGDISGALSDFGKGLVKSNPIGIAISEGKRLGQAFSKGYKDSLASEKLENPKIKAAKTDAIPDLNSDPDNISGGGGGGDKGDKNKKAKRDQAEKDLEKHLANLREIQAKHEADLAKAQAGDVEKGIIAIREKYRKEIEEATKLQEQGVKEAGEIRINLERLRDKEIEEYRDKARKDMLAKIDIANKSEADKVRAGYEEKFAVLREMEDAGLLTADEASVKRLQIQEKLNSDLNELAKKQADEKAKQDEEEKAKAEAKAKALQEIEQKYQDEKLKVLGTSFELVLAAVNKQYDDLLEAAKAAGVKQEEVDRLNNERRKALIVAELGEFQKATGMMASAFGSLGDAVGAMIDKSGKKMEGWIIFQKALTIAEIALNTAQAIASIIAAAAKSTTWYEALAGIVSGVAAVLTNMAKAKALLSTPTPKYQQKRKGGYTDVMGADDGRIYHAEQLGTVGTGMLPGHPVTILASEDGPEYFVSNPDLKKPSIRRLVADIDRISKGGSERVAYQMRSGGYTDVSSPTTHAISPTDLLMELIMENTKAVKALNQSIDKGIYSRIDNLTTVDIFERFRKLNTSAGGTLG